jgi:hypothetical protein
MARKTAEIFRAEQQLEEYRRQAQEALQTYSTRRNALAVNLAYANDPSNSASERQAGRDAAQLDKMAMNAAEAEYQSYVQRVNDTMAKIDALQQSAENEAQIDATPKPAPVVVKSGSGASVPSTTANGNGIGSSTSTIQTVNIPPSGQALTGESIDAAKKANASNTKYENSVTNVNNMQSQGLVGTDVYDQAKKEAFDSAEEQRIANENLAAANGNSLAATAEIEDGDPDSSDTSDDSSVTTSGTTTDELEANGATDEVQAEIVVTASPPPDPRIRIRAMGGQEDNVYGPADGVMAYLRETDGVFFPFTPNISYSHSVNYSQMVPTHANTDYWLYVNTPAVQIQISGQFSAQNLQEAQYMLAAMHFFRTVTKMRFGEEDEKRGMPPPVLLLSGYGDFMFNDLHVIVTNFSMELGANVDYIEVDIGDSKAWAPTLTTFTVSLTVQQTPNQQRVDFNFDRFASGEMFSNGRGWI